MEQKSLAILLAVYDPRIDWLTELLDSLNTQTYPDLHLYVRDDASPHCSMEALEQLLRERVTNFPWTLRRNEQNLGSNGTFAALVEDADEKLIAFCDQDDIWLPDKLKNSVHLLETSPLRPTLVCTDVSVMDGEGNEIAPDMEHHRKRHTFIRGEGLAKHFFFRNFVMGCTVVMERERALGYLPFPTGIVHDHYLAFRAAADGAIDYLAEPQMRYRVYGGNQTGVMTGVTTKEDYRRERIDVFAKRVETFAAFVPELPELAEIRAWSEARVQNFERKKGSRRRLKSLKQLNKSTTLFELIALRLPRPLFRLAVRAVQRRMI